MPIYTSNRVSFIRILLFGSLVTVLLLSACIRDKHAECEDEMISLRVVSHWEGQETIPEGIRLILYSLDSKRYIQDNFPKEGGEADIRKGNYQMFIYNNDSEKILFKNIGKYEDHEVFTNPIIRPSYISPVSGEETLGQPDKFWLDRIDFFELSSKSFKANFYPKQMVKKYNGYVEVEGIENAHEVRGAVTGMIGHLRLSTGEADNPSTIFFDANIVANTVIFNFQCFGVFHKESTPTKHYVALEFLLRKGIIQRNIDITEQMNKLLNGGAIKIEDELTIPPDTTGTEDGFNGNVDDWKEIIVPIII